MAEQGTMKTFMQGAVWLAMAGIIVKLLSAFYRVPFQNMVGDQGFYIYQQVYPFVGIFTVWTTYGLTVAVSKLLADHEPGARPVILKTAFGFLAVLSVTWFATLYAASGQLADWMGDAALAPLLRTAAFVALFMPFVAIMKGRLQFESRMQPVAFAQVGEQAVRVAVILAGTWFVLSQGLSLYAAGQTAIFGAVAGGFAAVLLLLPYRKGQFRRHPSAKAAVSRRRIIRQLAAISISVSMSSLILLLFQLADSFLVFRLLVENGMERMAAMTEKGVYDRAQPLVQFGIVLANSLVLSIVPLVAVMQKKKGLAAARNYAGLAFQLSLLFAVAAAAGLTVVMPYANEMLFGTRDGSVALIIFSWQIIPMSLVLVLTALLQGMGRVVVPVILLLMGLGIKIIANSLFVPLWGISGAAAAGNAGLFAAAAVLLLYMRQVWPFRFASARFYGSLAFATMIMAGVTAVWALFADGYLFDGLPGRIGAVMTAATAIPLGAAVFLTIIAKSRIISERHWFAVPFGRHLAAFQLKLQKSRQKEGEL